MASLFSVSLLLGDMLAPRAGERGSVRPEAPSVARRGEHRPGCAVGAAGHWLSEFAGPEGTQLAPGSLCCDFPSEPRSPQAGRG